MTSQVMGLPPQRIGAPGGWPDQVDAERPARA
jgi:hypothetical protein